jgi:uncharacterized protein (DUF2141 family)
LRTSHELEGDSHESRDFPNIVTSASQCRNRTSPLGGHCNRDRSGVFVRRIVGGSAVTVDGVRSAKGTVILELDNSDAQWDNKVAPFANGNINAQAGSVVYVFRDLKAGQYSVGVFHDENGNGKFDSNFLGIPKESWGFSNNPKGLRKASFDEASFSLGSENLAITIHLMRVI